MKMVDMRTPRSNKLLTWGEVRTGQVVELITGCVGDKSKLYMKTSKTDGVRLNDGAQFDASCMGATQRCLPMDTELHITGEKP